MERERIEVCDYNPQWASDFLQLKEHIYKAVGELAISIEHVGSTSVLSLTAKPILDIDIIIKEREYLPLINEKLKVIGYFHRGDLGIKDRESFKLVDSLIDLFPQHHLYVCIEDCTALRNHLALRDYLKANPEKAKAYGLLKKELVQKFPYDIDAYMTGKNSFIIEILKEIGFNQNTIDEIIGHNTV